jgi:predicted DNA-binding ribbon-helix-helix protein
MVIDGKSVTFTLEREDFMKLKEIARTNHGPISRELRVAVKILIEQYENREVN